MSFQLRNGATITAQMIARMTAMAPQITDYVEGAIIRSMAESVADELQRLDEAVYVALREVIVAGVYKAFGFGRKPASYASGMVRFTVNAGIIGPVTVAAGTVLGVAGSSVTYLTLQDAVIDPSLDQTFVDTLVQAQTVGSVGNTPAFTVTSFGAIGGIASVTNQVPFINGTDQESEAQRYNRFQNYIAGLSQGTVYAIRALAENTYLTDAQGNITEGVQNALVDQPFLRGEGFLGKVIVYIDNGSGTASPALIAAVKQNLAGYVDSGGVTHVGAVGAGVDFSVLAVVPQMLGLNVQISLLPGADPAATSAAVQVAITSYLQQLQVNDEAILTQIESAAITAGGVQDVRLFDANNNLLTANVQPPDEYRIVPGVITVTVVPQSQLG